MGDSGIQDTSDFDAWYRAAHPRLIAALVWVWGEPDGVSEAVDEACVRALAKWDRVGAMASPTGWTYRVALNVWRRQERRRALEERLLRRHPVRDEVPMPAGETWLLVQSLPPRQRTAITLRYVVDLTEAQIAAAMGVRRSTVSVLLRRAHERLASVVGEDSTPDREGVL